VPPEDVVRDIAAAPGRDVSANWPRRRRAGSKRGT
jgi:hypothetical protein